ncbi:MAG TPA: STAS domain-containing protein [Methylomirabilota bacterium]|nr:STAS domain-containing protein [Methylomirabilota bacterium]
MAWTVEAAEGGVRVALAGTLDVFEAAPFHALLVDLARRKDEVVMDLSACSRLDSAALQLLLAFRMALEADGRGLRVEPGASPVSRLLADCGLLGAPRVRP